MNDIGGQAVIEGVMMRSGNVWTVAVRSPEKQIIIEQAIRLAEDLLAEQAIRLAED